jgi:hypothetical protein
LKDKSGNNVQKIMKIGSFNLFEVGTVIESSEIGDYNTFQYRGIFLHIKMSLKIIDFNLFKKLMWKPTAKLIMVAQSELVLEYHRVRDWKWRDSSLNNIFEFEYQISLETVLENEMSVYYPGKIMRNKNFHEYSHKTSMLGMIDYLSKVIPKNNQLRK